MAMHTTTPQGSGDPALVERNSGGTYIVLALAVICGGVPTFLIGPPSWLGLTTPTWAWAVLWASLFGAGAAIVVMPSPRIEPLYGFLLLFLCIGLWALLRSQDLGSSGQALLAVGDWIIVLGAPLVLVLAAVLALLQAPISRPRRPTLGTGRADGE